MTATPPPIPIPSSSHAATHQPPLPLPMPASSSRSPPAFLTSRERERDRAHPYNRRQSISAAQNGTSPALAPRIYLEERERGDYSSMRSTAGPLSPLDRESSSSTSVSASYIQSPHSSYNGGGGGESHYRRDDYDSPGPATHDLTRSRSRSQSYARTGTESADRIAFSLPPLHTLAHFGERLGGGMPTPPLGEMLPPGSPRVGPVPNGNSSGSGLGLAGLRPSYAYDSPVMQSAQPKRYDAPTPRPPSPNYTSPSYPYPPISRQASYVSAASATSSLPTPARSRSHSSASAPGTATMRMAGLALNKQQQPTYERYEGAPTPLNPVTAPSPGGGVPQNRRMAHLQSEQKRRESINTGFASLRAVLPTSLATDSKAIVLRKAVAHIQKLEAMLPHVASQRIKNEPQEEDAQMIYDSDEDSRGPRRVSTSSEEGKRVGWECVQVEDVRLGT